MNYANDDRAALAAKETISGSSAVEIFKADAFSKEGAGIPPREPTASLYNTDSI